MADVIHNLKDIFNSIDSCDTRSFNKNIEDTRIIISKIENIDFIFNVLFLYGGRTLPHKIIIFIKKIFENVDGVMDGAVDNNIGCLVGCIDSKSKRARVRAIILLNIILRGCEKSFRENMVNKYDILVKISERLFDKESNVRKESIKFIEDFQMDIIYGKTTIINVLKDLLRYDPSADVRKQVMKSIIVNDISRNALIEKCRDQSVGIRRIFYHRILCRMELRELDQEQRVFLLRSAMVEKEFNASKILEESILRSYELPADINFFVEEFFDFEGENDFLVEILENLFSTLNFEFSFNDEFLAEINVYSSFLMKCFLSFVEKNMGRDNLVLPPLDTFGSLLYIKCKELLEDHSNVILISNLFSILHYYDFFSEENNNMILITIYRILTQINEIHIEKIVEESVIIAKILRGDNVSQFLGSIIKKNNENNKKSLLLSKYILKHIEYKNTEHNIHTPIINEIIEPLFKNKIRSKNLIKEIMTKEKLLGLEALFFYALKIKDNELLENILLCLQKNNKIEAAVDAYIYLYEKTEINIEYGSYIESTGILDNSFEEKEEIEERILEIIIEYFNKRYKKEPEDIIALSKVLMAGKAEDKINILLEGATAGEYNLRMYLDIFFIEYSRIHSKIFISAFLSALPEMKNYKELINKFIMWNDRPSNTLFYDIMIMGCKRKDSIKYYIPLLERIELNDKCCIKKILYVYNYVLKKADRNKMVGVLSRVTELDDGSEITQQEIEEVKKDMDK